MGANKRYIFQGHAVAAEARRPGTRKGWIHGAMALPVTGGFGRISFPGNTCRVEEDQPRITFDSVAAFVSGDFTDRDDDSSTAITVTAAYVDGLNVGNGKVR